MIDDDFLDLPFWGITSSDIFLRYSSLQEFPPRINTSTCGGMRTTQSAFDGERESVQLKETDQLFD